MTSANAAIPSPQPRLLLASRSARRQQLLREAGFLFEVEPADIDERDFPARLSLSEVSLHVARKKARHVAERFADDIVLAADTLIVFNERIIGQPKDADDARRTIRLLSGTTHIVITGVAIQCEARGLARDARVMSAVRMKLLTPGEIDRYIARAEWQGKAGAYGLQDDNTIIEKVNGCRTNVIGLPMTTAKKLLAEAGIQPNPAET